MELKIEDTFLLNVWKSLADFKMLIKQDFVSNSCNFSLF